MLAIRTESRSDTAQRSGSCLPSQYSIQWSVLSSDQFRKGDVPPLRALPRLARAFLSLFIGRSAVVSRSTFKRQSKRFQREGSMRGPDKGLVRERSKGPLKKGGDINKVTLFRAACWQDRCRGLFFEDFGRIKYSFVI